MDLDIIEKNSLKFSTLFLIIPAIDSYMYRNKTLFYWAITIYIVSILNHYKLWKWGRIIDLIVVRSGVIYVYWCYFKYLHSYRNLHIPMLLIINKILYLFSLYFNNNIIHSISHINYLYIYHILNIKLAKIFHPKLLN